MKEHSESESSPAAWNGGAHSITSKDLILYQVKSRPDKGVNEGMKESRKMEKG